jgi:hypothetical protein
MRRLRVRSSPGTAIAPTATLLTVLSAVLADVAAGRAQHDVEPAELMRASDADEAG